MRDSILAALTAFFVEPQYCGELDGGRENGNIWLECSCGAHTSSRSPAGLTRSRTRPVDERDSTMTHRLIGLILAAGTGLLPGGQLVIAADRIDLFDTNSNRTGYIIVDPKTKRFDTYDTKSKRTGWGTITKEAGDVQVYDKDGNRIGSGTLPSAGVKR